MHEYEKQRKKEEKEDKIAYETLKSQYQKTFSTDHGKAVLWEVLSMCGIFNESMGESPEKTAYNEGKRSIGLRILHAVIDADKSIFIDIMKEKEDG